MKTKLKQFINALNPRVNKRYIILFAGLVWGFAGIKILLIAWEYYQSSSVNTFITVPLILMGGALFFVFIMHPVWRKHSTRIITKETNKSCIFSFLDLKGYLLMILMITIGLSIRKLEILPPWTLLVLYGVMGLALFIAALLFIYLAIQYHKMKSNFTIGK